MGRILLLAIAVLLASLSGCSSEETPARESIKLFNTRDEAVRQYIKNEPNNGIVVSLSLADGAEFLLSKDRQKVYYLGQLVQEGNQTGAERITPGFKFDGEWVKWEIDSLEHRMYTVKLSKESTGQGTYLKELDIRVVIEEGRHQNSAPDIMPVNAILSYEVLGTELYVPGAA
ncbi:hypothetical protein [Paenibacillus tuaregi]|uniref:hypothetical protein n=1 Tax=Paenibacillus tuaregi TaxID=1816681 RepID=UPI000838BA2A|nr:hypothetical protein [Paenibacillus tuaregi]